MCHTTHSYVWHDSFIFLTWLILTCDMTPPCDMTRLFHLCDMTFRVCNVPIHMWDMIHSYLQCDNMCDITLPFVWHYSSYVWRAHSYVWHDSFLCVTWLVHMCDMTRSYVWHDSFLCVTYLVHMWDMTYSYVWQASSLRVTCLIESYVWHDSSIFATWLIHMCDGLCQMYDMTLSDLWHESFICVTWLIHVCDMTHSYVWHYSYVQHDASSCATWLVHMWDMNHSYVWHDSFICETWLIHVCNMTRSYVRHNSCICILFAVFCLLKMTKTTGATKNQITTHKTPIQFFFWFLFLKMWYTSASPNQGKKSGKGWSFPW